MRNSVCYDSAVVPRPDRFNASRRARSGFTLIELMVIVMIISIISALAGPGMMRALAASRAQRAVYDLSRLARRALRASTCFLLAAFNDTANLRGRR